MDKYTNHSSLARYKIIDDLIDISSVRNLELIYLWVIIMLPYQRDYCVRFDDEPIKVPHLPKTISSISSSFSLPHLIKTSKKRKVGEISTPQIQAMDLDDFKFDKFIFQDTIVINTLVTCFYEGFLGCLDLMRDLFNHFVIYTLFCIVVTLRKF